MELLWLPWLNPRCSASHCPRITSRHPALDPRLQRASLKTTRLNGDGPPWLSHEVPIHPGTREKQAKPFVLTEPGAQTLGNLQGEGTKPQVSTPPWARSGAGEAPSIILGGRKSSPHQGPFKSQTRSGERAGRVP